MRDALFCMIPASPAHGGVIAYMTALSLFNLVMALAETLQAFFMKIMHKLLYVNQSTVTSEHAENFELKIPTLLGKTSILNLLLNLVSHTFNRQLPVCLAPYFKERHRKKSVFDKVR